MDKFVLDLLKFKVNSVMEESNCQTEVRILNMQTQTPKCNYTKIQFEFDTTQEIWKL